MRLTESVSRVKGVGTKTHEALNKIGIDNVADLINYLPRRYDDFSLVTSIANLSPGSVVLRAKCESVETRTIKRGMRITTATLADGTGKIKAVWFNQPYREVQLRSGDQFLFTGKFGLQYSRYQLTSPTVELIDDIQQAEGSNDRFLSPVYRSIKGVKPRAIKSIMNSLRPTMQSITETLPPSVIKSQKLISRSDAMLALHFPETKESLDSGRRRVAFEELFEMMLAAQMNKLENHKLSSWKIAFDPPTIKAFVRALPFKLTDAQRRVAWEILQDFEKPHPMNRLLQGDVGSGKTVVAGLAALQATQAGLQSAIMAPTEILATQHAETLEGLLRPFGIRIALLTGSVKGAARNNLLKGLANGDINVVIGTHALIQDSVKYHKLGFVVIDEQHRFGVKQRQALLDKSTYMPHLLSMTATPIPRSLTLTLYGELDISIIDKLPAGRQEITTKIWSPASVPALYESVDSEIAKGRQVYVVCPLIEDDPVNDKASVDSEYRQLKSVFYSRSIGVVHGKLKPDEKHEVMQQFSAGNLDILISTTVVEVGVNIPNATVMIIKGADHFGLSQLHQLRGRVGRSSHKSYCHLVMTTHDKPSQRIKEIEKSQDGFYLAEVDLKLRGPGEVYGQAQHGALNLQVATLADVKLIANVQSAAIDFLKSGESLIQYKQLAQAVERYQRLTTLN